MLYWIRCAIRLTSILKNNGGDLVCTEGKDTEWNLEQNSMRYKLTPDDIGWGIQATNENMNDRNYI